MNLAQFTRAFIICSLILCAGVLTARAQTSTFTYQGRLTDSSAAANGSYDLQFTLYDSSGSVLGSLVSCSGAAAAGNVCEDVQVSNGVFTVLLDFGTAAFDGTSRALGIGVRQGSQTGAFTTLAPAQRITSTPYAMRSLFAVNADSATNATALGGVAANNYLRFNSNASQLTNLNASNVASGTLSDDRLSANVARRDTANTFTGDQTISGNLAQNGTTASGYGATALGERTAASGNSSIAIGYYASTNHFAGSFVYGDRSTTELLNASAANEFSVRAAGGYRLFTNAEMTTGVSLECGRRRVDDDQRPQCQREFRRGQLARHPSQSFEAADFDVELQRTELPAHRGDGAGLLQRIRGRRER